MQVQAQGKRITGPRFGVDVSGLVWQYVVPARKSVGVNFDFEVKPNIYPVVEAGLLTTDRKKATHRYLSKGYYAKLGFDHNFLKPQPTTRYDMLYGGFRAGASRFSHHAEEVTIHNDYWGNQIAELNSKNLNAFWIEAVAGVKTEVFKNLFFCWSVRGQLMLNKSKDPRMSPWLIPGYGRASKSTSLFVTYTISYRLPLFRVPSRIQ
jgi:hypothetical protein